MKWDLEQRSLAENGNREELAAHPSFMKLKLGDAVNANMLALDRTHRQASHSGYRQGGRIGKCGLSSWITSL